MVFRTLLVFFIVLALFISCSEDLHQDEKESLNFDKYNDTDDESDFFENSLIPSHYEEMQKIERFKENTIAKTLRELPGVTKVRVHLSLADNSILSHDKNAKSKGAVVLWVNDEALARDAIVNLLIASIKNIEPEDIKVFIYRQKAKPPIVIKNLGPLELTSSTFLAGQIVIVSLFTICIIMALVLIYIGFRLRNERKKRYLQMKN